MKGLETVADADRAALASEIETLTRELQNAQIDEAAKRALANQRVLTPAEQKDVRKFSISKMIRQFIDGNLDGIEAEMNEEGKREAQASHGRLGSGLFLPSSFLRTFDYNNATTATEGKEFVDITRVSFAEAIHNAMVASRLGVRFLDGLQGNVKIVKGGAAAASWAAEEGSVSAQKLAYSTGMLTPKRIQAIAGYSYDLLHQSSLKVDQLIIDELVNSIASALDTAIFAGSGSNGEPTGIAEASGVNTVNFAGAPTYAKIVEMETAVGEDNGLRGRLAYVTNAKVNGKMKTIPQVAGYPLYLTSDGKCNGYDLVITNEIPANYSTSKSGMIFGNFEEVLVGGWGGLNLIIDPFSAKGKGIVEVSAESYHDVLVRRPDHFAVAKDIVA